MQGAFSATPDQISWVITSYIVASAIMMPTSGWIASRLGRKRLLFICVLGFTIASLFCALANSLLFEVIARILQGMTGALILPLSNSLILDMYPKKIMVRHLDIGLLVLFQVQLLGHPWEDT